jgi:hypothetical protein
MLLIEFMRHLLVEWPQRWFKLPYSRDFATRLSNLDLVRTALSCPATFARFWTDYSFDMLQSAVQSGSACESGT